MKPVIFWLLLLGGLPLFADEMDSPQMHFFVVPSPSNTCFVVQTVLPWNGSENTIRYGRLQLFRSGSGAELWRINHILCYSSDILPSDDLHHLAIVRSYFRTHDADSVPVLLFYMNGKLLKSYKLKELGFDLAKLDNSVSHSSFVDVKGLAQNDWAWEWPLGTAAAAQNEFEEQNPRWHGAVFELTMRNGQQLHFDAKTGKILESKRVP